jgi:hypothetical protein
MAKDEAEVRCEREGDLHKLRRKPPRSRSQLTDIDDSTLDDALSSCATNSITAATLVVMGNGFVEPISQIKIGTLLRPPIPRQARSAQQRFPHLPGSYAPSNHETLRIPFEPATLEIPQLLPKLGTLSTSRPMARCWSLVGTPVFIHHFACNDARERLGLDFVGKWRRGEEAPTRHMAYRNSSSPGRCRKFGVAQFGRPLGRLGGWLRSGVLNRTQPNRPVAGGRARAREHERLGTDWRPARCLDAGQWEGGRRAALV